MTTNSVTTATNIPCQGAVCNQALHDERQLVLGNCSTKEDEVGLQGIGHLSPHNGATLQRPPLSDTLSSEQHRQELWGQCEDLASQPSILGCLVTELEALGVVGEQRAAKLIYLVLTSRFLERPLCAVVKGPSSAGKSFITDRVLTLFPPSAYHRVTGMSEKALAYGQDELNHRILVLAEAAGLSGGMGAYLLRTLITEGRIDYETVDTSDGLNGRRITREGPTGLLSTTTKLNLDPELETRLFSIPIDDSPEQTKAILLAIADSGRREVELGDWHSFQSWLEGAEHRVAIPYLMNLAGSIPPLAVRLRRDFGAIRKLIEVCAIMHQANRERDEEGRIISTLDDYSEVRNLVADIVSEGAGATVSDDVRETVGVVRSLEKRCIEGVPLKAIAQALNLDKSTVSRRVNKAAELGYLTNEEWRLGRPARIKVADSLPEQIEFLPQPAALQCCSVAEKEEGSPGDKPRRKEKEHDMERERPRGS